jgi:hypothetical protein
MNALTPLLARPESVAAVPSPTGLGALPAWARFVTARLFAQVLAGERHAQAAAALASRLERTPEARALAARQHRDETRHVAFFVRALHCLDSNAEVDPDVAAFLAHTTRAESLVELLIGTHLVIETLGHALFDATANFTAGLSRWWLLSKPTRATLAELSTSLERLQCDESQHLAFGILRLREERASLDAAGRRAFDATISAHREALAALFTRLPLIRLLRPWLGLDPRAVLAHYDARAKAIGVSS